MPGDLITDRIMLAERAASRVKDPDVQDSLRALAYIARELQQKVEDLTAASALPEDHQRQLRDANQQLGYGQPSAPEEIQ